MQTTMMLSSTDVQVQDTVEALIRNGRAALDSRLILVGKSTIVQALVLGRIKILDNVLFDTPVTCGPG